MTVQTYIDDLIKREGGYVNDPKDSGGETNFGITIATARAFGYTGAMSALPRSTAVEIYTKRYWIEPGFDRVNGIFPALAERLLDFGVLAGQGTSSKMLQRALNVLNRNGRDYPDMTVDGRIGTMTVGAVTAFLGKRVSEGRKVLLGLVASLQAVYLVELAERRPKDEEYAYGWTLSRSIGAVMGG